MSAECAECAEMRARLGTLERAAEHAAAERARQSRTAYLLTAAEERMRREREPTPRR